MIQQEIPIIESVDIQTEIAFNNLCLQDGGGKEQRIILWQDPIRTFNLHKEIVYQVQLNQLREFFDLTKGSLESFFYRDKSDWQASRVKQLRSDVQTYGTLYGLGGNEYQTCKAYQVGSTIYLRPIACPFNLALFNGETVVTGWTLGDNGKVTFSGTFNSVSFDFYVPVRFETDDLERQITAKSEPDNYVVYSIPKLVLKEVKIDFDDNVVDTFQKNSDHILSLDLLKGTEIVQYQTDILSQESGFEKRSLVQETPTTINNLQARNIVYQDDIEYLIALWLCVKGEGASFYFDNGIETNRVRFVSKSLSYTCQSNALVYSLGGIGVRELLPPVYTETITYIQGQLSINYTVVFTWTSINWGSGTSTRGYIGPVGAIEPFVGDTQIKINTGSGLQITNSDGADANFWWGGTFSNFSFRYIEEGNISISSIVRSDNGQRDFIQLSQTNLVSLVVKKGATTLTEGIDYSANLSLGQITPLVGGAINNGDTLAFEYTY